MGDAAQEQISRGVPMSDNDGKGSRPDWIPARPNGRAEP